MEENASKKITNKERKKQLQEEKKQKRLLMSPEEKRQENQKVKAFRQKMQEGVMKAAIVPDDANVATTLFRYLHSMAQNRKMRLCEIRWDSINVGGSPQRYLHFFAEGMEWILGANDNDHAFIRK